MVALASSGHSGSTVRRGLRRRIGVVLGEFLGPAGELEGNAIRIMGTGVLTFHFGPKAAEGFFHEFSGWVMFVVSLACLYLVHRAMRLISPVKAKLS